jgi:hypothetical protein
MTAGEDRCIHLFNPHKADPSYSTTGSSTERYCTEIRIFYQKSIFPLLRTRAYVRTYRTFVIVSTLKLYLHASAECNQFKIVNFLELNGITKSALHKELHGRPWLWSTGCRHFERQVQVLFGWCG